MKDSNKIVKNIERLGERYCKKYLYTWNEKKLKNDWWEALKFFFNHSFMRGRRDELSNEYYYFTIKSIGDYFSIAPEHLDKSYEKFKEQREHFNKDPILKFKEAKNIGRGNSIKHQDFKKEMALKNPIVGLLVTKAEIEVKWDDKIYKKNIFLGNDEDIMMVLDVLKFVSEDGRKNIYNYLKGEIVNSGVKSVYKELTEMRAISDKIATFIIRDIGLMNPEIAEIIKKKCEYAFPVDTLIKNRIAPKLGCTSKDNGVVKQYFIKKCEESYIDPLKFAAGLWFLGFHSLDILLENCLGDVEIESITSSNSG